VRDLIQSVLGKFGYRVIRAENVFQPRYGLKYFFPLLKERGFAPKHIIDVGANRGVWTRAAVKFFPDAQYTLVEPQDNLRMYVQDLFDAGYKVRWINAGASDQSGTLPFTIFYRDDSSSFRLTEEQASAAGFKQVTVKVKTLNEIVALAGGSTPEMVKIDAEGLDLKAFAGASDLFGETEIFLLEAGICADFQNTVGEVIGRLSQSGYKLLDITDLNRSPKYGVLWLCELAFIRKNSRLLDGVVTYE
jgi:FkbM family methyltransferase